MSENARAAAVVAAANASQAALAVTRREALQSRFGDEALAWLALVPLWTEPLAEAVSFPLNDRGVRGFLDEAAAVGLVEREPERRADPGLGRTFWMAETDRVAVLDAYRDVITGDGTQWLRDEALRIAGRLTTLAEVPMPDAVRQWATVAAGLDRPFEAARALRREIANLTGGNEIGQAVTRVDAGQALARAFGNGPLKEEALLGARRVEVAYRRASDERHLQHYVRQDDQVRAFDDLLADEQAWALHYLGIGGIGKTMLLRDITARLSRERGVVVSRLDFDHLNPQFPALRPGQLLLALAADLRGAGDTTKTDSLVDQVAESVLTLHEKLGNAPPPGDPLRNVRRAEFTTIVDTFCDLLRTIPQPVVLLLDTCEELARIPIDAGILPSLEATFEILERVHQQIGTMRAVFAGRRPIASGGAGWRLAREPLDPRTPLGQRQAVLKDRPFLRLYEIRGLDEGAARRLLEHRLGPSRAPAVVEAILAGSHVSRGPAIVGRDGRNIADGRSRFSPFDLMLYADWARDDPELSADRIAAGDSDPYVEVRIVQRVQNPRLKAALPGIVALGRFDLAMVQPVLPPECTSDEMAELFAELADYEWLSIQVDDDRTFLEVDRQLLPRLRRYFTQPVRIADVETARARLGPGLQALVRDTPLSALSVTHIDAALAVLAPAEAARLWVEILVRVPSEAGPDWLRGVTERVMSEDGAGERQPELAAGFEAARYVVGRMAPSPTSPVPAPLPGLEHWPDEETGAWLGRCEQAIDIGGIFDAGRAAGALTVFAASIGTRLRQNREAARAPREAAFVACMAHEEAAACLLAADWIATRLLWPDAPQMNPTDLKALRLELAALLDTLALASTGVNLVATGTLTCARLALAAADHAAVTAHVNESLQLAALSGGASRRWLHWCAPDSLVDRIRLEVLALQRDFAIDLDAPVESWHAGATARDHSIDGERLASAIIRWRLYRGVIDAERITWTAPLFDPDRRPWAPVHIDTPPLFVSRAMAYAALGRWSEADRQLQDIADAAERSRRDPETVRIAHYMRLQIACQSRDAGDVAATLVFHDHPPTLAMWQRMQALTGDEPIDADVLSWHERWPATSANRRRQLQSMAAPPPLVGRSTLADRLDLVEAKRLGLVAAWPASADGDRVTSLDELLRVVLRLHGLQPVTDDECPPGIRVPRAIRRLLPFSLRHATPPGLSTRPLDADQRVDRDHLATLLTDAGRPSTEAGRRVLEQVGRRRLAQIALDEGELLGLRLPASAEVLLELAAALADAADDPVGTVRSLTTAQLLRGGRGQAQTGGAFTRRLEPAWRAALAHEAALPSWRELEREPLAHDLPPWAVRAAVGRLFERGVPLDTMTAIVDPAAAGVNPAQPRVRIPELGPGPLGDVPETTDDPQDDSRSEEPGASPPPAAGWRRLTFDAVLAAIAAGATLPAILALTPRRTLGRPVQLAIAIAVGAVVAAIVSRWIRRWMRGWAAVHSQAHVDVTPTRDGRTEAIEFAEARLDISLLRVRFQLWPPLPVTGDAPPRSRTVIVPDVRRQTYEESAAAIDRAFVADLADVRDDLVDSDRVWPVPLRGASALPWEALLTRAVARLPLGSGEPVFFYRTDPSDRRNTVRTWRDMAVSPIVLIAASGIHHAEPWLDARRQPRAWTGDHLSDEVGIVHAVGTPVMAAGRARLRIGDADGTARVKARTAEQLESAALHADLLDRAALPHWMPLLVLQQTPSEVPARLASDRDQAALLRSVAAELSRSCGAVIAIPSLPPALADRVVRALAHRTRPATGVALLVRHRLLTVGETVRLRELTQLACTVRHLRELVLQWPEFGPPDDPRREAAWDIVLFARTPGNVSY